MKKFFATAHDPTLALMRVILGIIFFMHGFQKAFGWFGGFGFHGTMHFFTGMLHIPAFFALLAILAESVGSILLLLGFFTRFAAFCLLVDMMVAIFRVHVTHGFFSPMGYEYPLTVAALAFLIMIKGAGSVSIDYALGKS